MRISKARLVATAGLALTLAFGAVGCSTKTEVTTSDGETTTTTTTETKDGNTTTTTTETKEGTSTPQESTTTDPSQMKSYTIEAIGMVYDLPEGFTFKSIETDLDVDKGSVQAFMAQNDGASNINLIVSKGDGTVDVTKPEYMDAAKTAVKESVAGMGYSLDDSNIKEGTVELEGITLPTLEMSYEIDGGVTISQKQAYATGNNGGLILTFTATSDDPTMLDTMLKGIKAQ